MDLYNYRDQTRQHYCPGCLNFYVHGNPPWSWSRSTLVALVSLFFVSKTRGFQSFVHPQWTHRYIENHPILGAPAPLQGVYISVPCYQHDSVSQVQNKARAAPSSEAKEASLMGYFKSPYGMICRSSSPILQFEHEHQGISLRPSIQVAKELSRSRATNCLRET